MAWRLGPVQHGMGNGTALAGHGGIGWQVAPKSRPLDGGGENVFWRTVARDGMVDGQPHFADLGANTGMGCAGHVLFRADAHL